MHSPTESNLQISMRRRALRGAILGLMAAFMGWSATNALSQEARTAAPPKTASAAPTGFAGAWQTSFGLMQLSQTGNRITGTYNESATIEGVVEGRKLTFRYQEVAASGQGWFEISKDGKYFAGRWLENGETLWRPWNGRRTTAPKPPVKNYTGLWSTSFGRMRLVQHGDQVSGSYALDSESKVKGQVKDGKLNFKYTESQARGEGTFQLSPDKNQFAGRWRPAGSSQWQPWTGRRVVAKPGKIWLVVLEAHWEQGLNEPEYAFGDMLRSYFKMAPARHIEVRHRYFHDETDFRRFCAEVPYLAEPVVLLISTHGTEKGILVGGKTIGPKVIAESLQGASNIRLLHLSGCSMMNGPAPKQIIEQIPPEDRFPISGYSTVVAWDASAISDFVFLSMLMVHRMEPAEAAKQAILAAPYLGSKAIRGSAYRPLGLKVLTPPRIVDSTKKSNQGVERRAK